MFAQSQISLRLHQASVKTKATFDFKSADRGKLIMACGTWKNFETEDERLLNLRNSWQFGI